MTDPVRLMTADQVADDSKVVKRLLQFAESLADGPCWGSPNTGPEHDCPSRMHNGHTRPADWCRRCQAKYWVLERDQT